MFIANVLAGLRDRGHEVKIVSRMDVRDFWLGRLPARRLMAEAVLVRGDMKRFSPDAWIIYASSTQYPDLFGWWQRPKRYALLGCEGAEDRKAKALPDPWRWLFTVAHRHSLERADKIIVVRPKVVRSLRSAGVPEERVCLLPLAIKTWARVPCREEARRVLGLPQDATVILCVSRLSVRRGKDDPRPGKTEAILDLLLAFALLPSNSRLLVVGDGRGRRELEQEAAKLKLGGRVQFVGTVEHDEVSWYYAACDFFAFPDENDRPCQAILEAQACGRAVVSTQTGSTELTVDAGRTGLLAKDLKEFQAHVLALVHDRGRCEELGRAGPAYIARFFSIENRVRQIEELLLGLPGGSGAGVRHEVLFDKSERELQRSGVAAVDPAIGLTQAEETGAGDKLKRCNHA